MGLGSLFDLWDALGSLVGKHVAQVILLVIVGLVAYVLRQIWKLISWMIVYYRRLNRARRDVGRVVTPIPYFHGPLPVLGYRVGNLAYCPDCNRIPDESRSLLQGLDVLILNGLRRRPHPTHFTIDEAVEEARRIGARRTYFTHIAHELGHAATNAELPDGMALSYDGLVCELE